MEQTILVTGSTSGFGRLTVETLVRQGYRVFAGMRAAAGKNAPAAEELRALAQREQLALQVVEIDVTHDASVERAIAEIIETTDRLDVVVGADAADEVDAFGDGKADASQAFRNRARIVGRIGQRLDVGVGAVADHERNTSPVARCDWRRSGR